MDDPTAGDAPPETDEQLAERLMRFYNVESLHALIREQNRHVEKLQTTGYPGLGFSVGERALNRVREG